MTTRLIILFFITSIGISFAQEEPETKKAYTTKRYQKSTPRIDGILDDEAWEEIEWGGNDFIQRSPDDGADPTTQTKFKITYDDKNIYIAMKCYDPDPSKIVSRMSRRDGFDGDRISVMFDSYFDKRTAFSFTASVSGVKGEEYVSNNGDNWDEKWDPIWYLATSIDTEGWNAEIRIPLSQLRFADKPEHIWGLQFSRYLFRSDEWQLWSPIAQDANGWVHLFGELHGIKGIRPQKQLEIQPYIVAKTEKHLKEEGNPYADGQNSNLEIGVDAKIGITSDITMDLTVNPDFGQVEADPSQVNLTAFQLFFPEQRPFFIEGSNILTFPVNSNSDNLFYSRRIGRKPQVGVDTDRNGADNVNEYVDISGNSRILTSLKLTGKNKNGFSWGVLESYTLKEEAEIDSLGFRRSQTVEPATNYLVGRVQQDLDGGKTVFGGMITSVKRQNEAITDHLVDDAYSGGVDFLHFFNDRKYYVSGKIAASKVSGSTDALTQLQYSSVRYYQRPDNNYKDIDTTMTQMIGSSGSFQFGKGSGKFLYSTSMAWSSPGLELNDAGFMSQTDQIVNRSSLQYRITNPTKIFRSLNLNLYPIQKWDFGNRLLERRIETDHFFQFKNLWAFSTGGLVEFHNASNADLRGGPTMRYPNSYSYWAWIGTNNRKKVRLEINPWWDWAQDNFRHANGWWTRLRMVPTDAVNIDIVGHIRWISNELQYVSTETSTNGNSEYLLANIDQKLMDVSLRLTYVITPNLSIQYWGRPFAASGQYSNFKRVVNGNAENYNDRFVPLTSSLNEETGLIDLDENNDGNVDYSIGNPDFNFTQFQSNMVLRWEYIPGSTLFLVWTQSRTEFPDLEKHTFDHLYNALLDKYPTNVFLIKYTYRFVL